MTSSGRALLTRGGDSTGDAGENILTEALNPQFKLYLLALGQVLCIM